MLVLRTREVLLNLDLIIFFSRNYSYRNQSDYINQYLNGLITNNPVVVSKCITDVCFGTTGNFVASVSHNVLATSVCSTNLSIKSIIDNSHKLNGKLNIKLLAELNQGMFVGKQYTKFRLNTTQEIICSDIVHQHLALTKLDLNRNLTGQHKPDYVGCSITKKGQSYVYYVDLKRTTYAEFEKAVYGITGKKDIYCNIHLIGDFNQNYVFNPRIRMYLERSYYDVYNYNINSNDPVATSVAIESLIQFKYFRVVGSLKAYNQISLNTPKFLTLDMINASY